MSLTESRAIVEKAMDGLNPDIEADALLGREAQDDDFRGFKTLENFSAALNRAGCGTTLG